MRKDIELKKEIFRRKTTKKLLVQIENYKKNSSYENLEEIVFLIEKSIKILKYIPIIDKKLSQNIKNFCDPENVLGHPSIVFDTNE